MLSEKLHIKFGLIILKEDYGHQLQGATRMKFNFIFIILMFSIGFSKSNKGPSLTNNKWISNGSPKSEVWFQDWSGYVRLFVTTFSDTSSVDPGPYITETKNRRLQAEASKVKGTREGGVLQDCSGS